MKNKKYLHFIAQKDCVVSGTPAFGESQIIVHHLTCGADRGISQKPSDYRTVPLRSDIHMLLHHQGEADFWVSRGIDPYMKAMDYLIEWVENA